MNRFFPNTSHPDVMDEAPDGEYVLYEDVEPIVADRDIKAANLQLLVEKVLTIDEAVEVGDHTVGSCLREAVNLARSLKQ